MEQVRALCTLADLPKLPKSRQTPEIEARHKFTDRFESWDVTIKTMRRCLEEEEGDCSLQTLMILSKDTTYLEHRTIPLVVPPSLIDEYLERSGTFIALMSEIIMKTRSLVAQYRLMDRLELFIQRMMRELQVRAAKKDFLELWDKMKKAAYFIIPPEWFLDQYLPTLRVSHREALEHDGGVSTHQRWVQSAFKLSNQFNFYYDGEVVGPMIEEMFECTMLQQATDRDHLMLALLLVMVSEPYSLTLLKSGKLIKWWNYSVVLDNSAWERLIYNHIVAALYMGWEFGEPVDHLVLPYVPRILGYLGSFVFNLVQSEDMNISAALEGDAEDMCADQFSNTSRCLATTLVLLLRPFAQRPEDVEKLDFNKGLNPDELRPLQDIKVFAFDVLQDLLSILSPLTHSHVSLGDYETILAHFIQDLTFAYASRIALERSPEVSEIAYRDKVTNVSGRLGRLEDIAISHTIFEMAWNGIKKAHGKDENSWTTVLKACFFIDPQTLVPRLVDRLLPTLYNDSEPLMATQALLLFRKFARPVILYAPQAIPVLFSLAPSFFTLSDPRRTQAAAGMYFQLVIWMEGVDMSGVDYYGFDWASTMATLTPMFGYKTKENKHLFDEWKYPVLNLSNYPDERLDDDLSSIRISEAPNVSETDIYEDVPCGYQTPEEIERMVTARAQAGSAFPEFMQNCVTLWTDIYLNNPPEATPNDVLAVYSHTLSIISTQCPDLCEGLAKQLMKKWMEKGKGDTMHLLGLLPMGPKGQQFSNVKYALSELEPLILTKDGQLSPKLGHDRLASHVTLLAGATMRSWARDVIPLIPKLAHIVWLCLNHGRKQIFDVGCGFYTVLSWVLERPNRPSPIVMAERCPKKDDSDYLAKWQPFQLGLPVWLQLPLEDTGNALGTPYFEHKPQDWTSMDDRKRDILLTLHARVIGGTLERLLVKKFELYKINNFGNFNPTAFKEATLALVKRPYDLPLPDVLGTPDDVDPFANDKATNQSRIIKMLRVLFKVSQRPELPIDDERRMARQGLLPGDPTSYRKILERTGRDCILATLEFFQGIRVHGETMTFEFGDPLDTIGGIDVADVLTCAVHLCRDCLTLPVVSLSTMRNHYELALDPAFSLQGREWLLLVNNQYIMQCASMYQNFRMSGLAVLASVFDTEARDLTTAVLSMAVGLAPSVRRSAWQVFDDLSKVMYGESVELQQANLRCVVSILKEATRQLAQDKLKKPSPTPIVAATPIAPPVSGVPDESGVLPPSDSKQIDQPVTTDVESHVSHTEGGDTSYAEPETTSHTDPGDTDASHTDAGEASHTDIGDVSQHGDKVVSTKTTLLEAQELGACPLFTPLWYVWRMYPDGMIEAILAVLDRTAAGAALEGMRNLLPKMIQLGIMFCVNWPYPDKLKYFLTELVDRVSKREERHWRATCAGLCYIAQHMTKPAMRLMNEDELDRMFRVLLDSATGNVTLPVCTAATYALTRLLKLVLSKTVPPMTSLKELLASPDAPAPGRLIAIATRPASIKETKHVKVTKPVELFRAQLTLCTESYMAFPAIYTTFSDDVAQPKRLLLFYQTLFQIWYRYGGSEWVLKVTEKEAIPLLTSWAEQPIADRENHVAVVGVIAGMLRASRLWDLTTRTRAMDLIAPVLTKQASKCNTTVLTGFWTCAFKYLFQGFNIPVKFPRKSRTFEEIFQPDPKCFPDGYVYVTQLVNLILNGKAESTKLLPVTLGTSDTEESSHTCLRQLNWIKLFLESNRPWPLTIVDWAKSVLFNDSLLCSNNTSVREGVASALRMYQCAIVENLLLFRRAERTPDTAWLERMKELEDYVYGNPTEFVEVVKRDAAAYRARQARDPGMNRIKTLMEYVHLGNRQASDLAVNINDVKLLDLMLQLYVHPDDELSSMGHDTLLILTSNRRFPHVVEPVRLILKEFGRLWDVPQEWQYKEELLVVMRQVHARNRIASLGDPNRFNSILALYDKAIRDENAQIQAMAQFAFIFYLATLSSAGCEKLCQKYLKEAGKPFEVTRDKVGPLRVLSAAITTFPHTCPYWLPSVLTEYARFGSRKCPDNIRNMAQETLQAFFGSHLSDWQDQKKKFTESQLSVLNEYKGLPIYLS